MCRANCLVLQSGQLEAWPSTPGFGTDLQVLTGQIEPLFLGGKSVGSSGGKIRKKDMNGEESGSISLFATNLGIRPFNAVLPGLVVQISIRRD